MSDYVLLFSHGNASDLGFMIDTLIGKYYKEQSIKFRFIK